MGKDWLDYKEEFEKKTIDPIKGQQQIHELEEKIGGFESEIDDLKSSISHAEDEIVKVQEGMNFGFRGLDEDWEVDCPRCKAKLTKLNDVKDVGIVCGWCGNHVTDNELSDILCTPECVLA